MSGKAERPEYRNVGLVLIAHGSKLAENKLALEKLVEMARSRGVFKTVKLGFLELSTPTIPEAVKTAFDEGVEKAIVIPVFIAEGMHTRQDIPKLLRADVPDIEESRIVYGEPLGVDERLVDILLDRANEAIKKNQ